MIKKYGKPIDSGVLKKDLNKLESVTLAKRFSESFKPGETLANCPICGTKDSKFIQQIYGFKYSECQGCKVLFVSNPVSEAELENVYRSEYYTNANKILLANDRVIDYRISNIANPKVEYILDNLTSNKRTWLDIGCGVGEIISVVVNKGYEAVGIETNEMERDYAIKKFNVKIENEYLKEENIKNYKNQYGVVSLFGILEHLIDPKTVISHISKMQEKDDNLVIEVPHYPSISVLSQITFPDKVNRMLHPPLHLFMFSLKSLETLLEQHSYKITNAWFFGQDIYEFFSTLALIVEGLNGSILYKQLSDYVNDFQKIIDSNEMSDEVLIIAKKM